MVRLIPFFALSEYRIQDCQQFVHTGNPRRFFGFSGCNQTHVKRLYNRIKIRDVVGKEMASPEGKP